MPSIKRPYFFCTHCKAGLLALAMLLTGLTLKAATYYSKVATGNFNAVGSWTADTIVNGNIPSIGTTNIFIIRNGHNITFNATQTVEQLIVRSGGTMTMGSSNYTLNTTSPLTVNAGGTLTFNARRLTVGGSGDWVNDGTISMTTGYLIWNAGTGINNGSIAVTSSGRLVRTTGSLINSGTITMAASSQFTATTGSFTNTATGTLTFAAAGTVTLGTGNFINDNTSASVNFGTINIALAGSVAEEQLIGGFVTGGRVSLTKTAGSALFTGNITSNGLTVNGTGGTLDLGDGLTHTTNANVQLSAGSLLGNSSTLNITVVSTSAWTGSNAPGFVPGTSTVNFSAAGDQRISVGGGDRLFYNLSFSNSGIKTTSVATTIVSNVFSIEGDAVCGAAANTIPSLGANATLRYNTPNSRTCGLEWITPFTATGGVLIDNTGAITPNGSKVFNENIPLTISTGSTLSAGANNFTFNGNFVNNGVWTSSSGGITITGTVNQDIGSFSTTGTVLVSKTDGTAIMQGNMNTGNFIMNANGGIFRLGSGNTHTVSGIWTNTNGTLRCNTSTFNIDGDVSGTAITFTPNNSTVHFRGSSPQAIPDFTYHNLEFSGAGLKTLSGNTTVNEILTINAESELNLSSVTLDLTGEGIPLVNNGIFTAASSTVSYSNAESATIAAVDYYNLDGTGGDRTLPVSDTIGIMGSFIPGSGIYTVPTSNVVDFNGTGDQDIPAFSYGKLVISNAGIKKILANVIVACRSIDIEDDASVEINGTGGGKLNVLD